MKTNKILVVLALFFVLKQSAFAEISPAAYKEMRDASPEIIEMKVDKVLMKRVKNKTFITIKAIVLGIKKTKVGLKKGQSIDILYSRTKHDDKWIGPMPIPILAKGKNYVAHLSSVKQKKNKRHYVPFAMGHSFDLIKNKK